MCLYLSFSSAQNIVPIGKPSLIVDRFCPTLSNIESDKLQALSSDAKYLRVNTIELITNQVTNVSLYAKDKLGPKSTEKIGLYFLLPKTSKQYLLGYEERGKTLFYLNSSDSLHFQQKNVNTFDTLLKTMNSTESKTMEIISKENKIVLVGQKNNRPWIAAFDADSSAKRANSVKNWELLFDKDTFSQKLPQVQNGCFYRVKAFDNDNIILAGEWNDDFFMVCISWTGKIVWIKKFGAKGKDCVRSLYITPEKNIVFAGYSDSYNVKHNQCYLGMLSKEGKFLWGKTVGKEAKNDAYISQIMPKAKGFLLTGNLDSALYILCTDNNGNFSAEIQNNGLKGLLPYHTFLINDSTISTFYQNRHTQTLHQQTFRITVAKTQADTLPKGNNFKVELFKYVGNAPNILLPLAQNPQDSFTHTKESFLNVDTKIQIMLSHASYPYLTVLSIDPANIVNVHLKGSNSLSLGQLQNVMIPNDTTALLMDTVGRQYLFLFLSQKPLLKLQALHQKKINTPSFAFFEDIIGTKANNYTKKDNWLPNRPMIIPFVFEVKNRGTNLIKPVIVPNKKL